MKTKKLLSSLLLLLILGAATLFTSCEKDDFKDLPPIEDMWVVGFPPFYMYYDLKKDNTFDAYVEKDRLNGTVNSTTDLTLISSGTYQFNKRNGDIIFKNLDMDFSGAGKKHYDELKLRVTELNDTWLCFKVIPEDCPTFFGYWYRFKK